MIKISKLLGLVAALGREQSTGEKADRWGMGWERTRAGRRGAAECRAVEGQAGRLGSRGMDGGEQGYLGCRGPVRRQFEPNLVVFSCIFSL